MTSSAVCHVYFIVTCPLRLAETAGMPDQVRVCPRLGTASLAARLQGGSHPRRVHLQAVVLALQLAPFVML